MECGSLLSDSKWNIIKELASKEQTPTDLAEKTKTSLANISQQLRLLEAYGLVKKERKEISNNPGKPKTIYNIGKKINYLISINYNQAIKKELNLDYIQKAIVQIFINESNENAYFLEKFMITNEEIVKKCDFIGIIKSADDKIELLLITKHIDEIRQKYSNQTISNIEDKKKTIVCWTHNLDEIQEGIRTSNEHFTHLISNFKTIMDKGEITKKIEDIKRTK